jgi:hypothetical protein
MSICRKDKSKNDGNVKSNEEAKKEEGNGFGRKKVHLCIPRRSLNISSLSLLTAPWRHYH